MVILYIGWMGTKQNDSRVVVVVDRKLLHYNTTLAIMFLFPLVLFSGELGEIMSQSESIYDMGFWILMVSGNRGIGLYFQLALTHGPPPLPFYRLSRVSLDLVSILPCSCRSSTHLHLPTPSVVPQR